jgi:hypothetical protein
MLRPFLAISVVNDWRPGSRYPTVLLDGPARDGVDSRKRWGVGGRGLLVALRGRLRFSTWQGDPSRIGANRVLIYQYLVTLGVASGVLLLGEDLTASRVVGEDNRYYRRTAISNARLSEGEVHREALLAEGVAQDLNDGGTGGQKPGMLDFEMGLDGGGRLFCGRASLTRVAF